MTAAKTVREQNNNIHNERHIPRLHISQHGCLLPSVLLPCGPQQGAELQQQGHVVVVSIHWLEKLDRSRFEPRNHECIGGDKAKHKQHVARKQWLGLTDTRHAGRWQAVMTGVGQNVPEMAPPFLPASLCAADPVPKVSFWAPDEVF